MAEYQRFPQLRQSHDASESQKTVTMDQSPGMGTGPGMGGHGWGGMEYGGMV